MPRLWVPLYPRHDSRAVLTIWLWSSVCLPFCCWTWSPLNAEATSYFSFYLSPHLFNKCVLSTYYMPGNMVSAGDPEMDKTHKTLAQLMIS